MDYEDDYEEVSHIKEDKSKDFRGRHLNRLSRRFGAQVESNFLLNDESGSTGGEEFNLAKIYFAKSPLSSGIIQHPLYLPQLELHACTLGPKQQRHFTFPEPGVDLKPEDHVCTSVLIERLDEIQKISKREFLWHLRGWGFGLTLTPTTQKIQLRFKGTIDWKCTLDGLIVTHFGRESVILLNAGNVLSTPLRSGKFATVQTLCKESKYGAKSWDRMHQFSSLLDSYKKKTKDSQEIFDAEDHNVILVPPFSRGGFDASAIKNELEFPFQVQFVTSEGEVLKHEFRLPLKFQTSPQRLRLKFIFQRKDQLRIVCYSHLMIYSIIPTESSPTTTAASIQIYHHNSPKSTEDQWNEDLNLEEKGGDGNGLLNRMKEKRFVKRFFDCGDIDKYWGTGKRIRYNTAHVDTLTYNGFKVGFNYNYEIKPRPNSELRHSNHRERIRAREDLRRNMRSDLKDYYAYYE